jgi:hypothetical protein
MARYMRIFQGCCMNETYIQQRFHLMQKEIEATAILWKDAKIDLTAAVDSLKIELEVM